jgi:hypothetical protein
MKTVTAMLATAAFLAADVSASTGEIVLAFEQEEPTLAYKLRQDYGAEGDEEEVADDGAADEADEEEADEDSEEKEKPDSEKTVAELL